jgi:proteic killer suppression protein
VIKSFKSKRTRALFEGERAKEFEAVRKVALRKLDMVDAAARLIDLRKPPNNRLEALKGDRKGQHSIRISNRWRLCFVWRGGHAHGVEIVDYH